MKTIHDYLCDCCPPDATNGERHMKISAEWIEGKFLWRTEERCAHGHYPNMIDSDALKAAHAKAQA